MNEPPRRRWFQWRLSTLLVLMFVASIFVALNFTSRLERTHHRNRHGYDQGRGWPEMAYWSSERTWNWPGLLTDIALFCGSIAGVGLFIEFVWFSASLAGMRALLWPLHFSTALLAVSLTLVLGWFNVMPRYDHVGYYPKLHSCWCATFDGPGWPWPIKIEGYAEATLEAAEQDYYSDVSWRRILYERAQQVPLFGDVLFAGVTVGSVCLGMQFLWRRRQVICA